jgi:hypothetical protein
MSNKLKKSHVRGSKSASTATASEQGNRQVLAEEKKRVESEASVSEHKVENSADENARSQTDVTTRDEKISACFERARKNLNELLKSKKQVIRELACDLERLGRPVDHIAAEIVHELRNCEELSRSQIYSYLDDKYKNQNQAQRRKGKSNPNPDPKTGTESPQERIIMVGNNGQQTTSNKHDIPELNEPADTTADSVTSNQQSTPANLQKSDLNPDPKTGTESWSSEQGRTGQSANTNTNASELGSMTPPPTSPHMTGEDSMFPGPRNKSLVCENCPIKDNRIKKLEDENRELSVRCEWTESNNSELALQLTAREKDIEKLLEDGHDLSHLPEKYVGQECPRCRELEEKVVEQASEFEFTISKEKYDMVKDAMDKSKSAIFVKCYGSKKFVHVVADVDN